MSLCGVQSGLAKTAEMPAAHGYAVRDDRQLSQELQKLLRRVSFNIIRMEKGFTISVFRERMKFEYLEPLGDEHKRYKISGPRVNGILELKMDDGSFYDMRFWESAPDAPLSVRMIHIDELQLRRR